MVHFIGAGPGAPDLITVRGQKLLGEADIIIYAGSLVNPALLDLKKEGCVVYNSATMTLEQVIDEYTKVELRSLASVPLRLSRDEVEQLVVRAAEQHWSYDGDYYFVSNNCAVETLKLLRSGTGNPRLQALDSILPNGLLELMNARGLADTRVLDDPREAYTQLLVSSILQV